MSQNVDALLGALDGRAPARILDLGCGPGRDLCAFRARGHEAVGIDGSAAFAAMARAASGCEVWQQRFAELDLPPAAFDGVFANASLFHVPSAELPEVLRRLRAALVSDGVLFASIPRDLRGDAGEPGAPLEGWNGERWGVYWTWEGWREQLRAAGFAEIRHWYRPPGLPRAQQPWLASLWRKAG